MTKKRKRIKRPRSMPRTARGVSLEDRVFAIETWVRTMTALTIPKRLMALEHVPPVENEHFMELIAREMVKQNFGKGRP